MRSVLQDWVMELPLRVQGTLLTAVRGCDDEAKTWNSVGVAYSPGRRLTAFIRCCFMVPADEREVGAVEGSFMHPLPPNPFKASEFGHLPQHWYSHAMHALEVIGFYAPHERTDHRQDNCKACEALHLYHAMVSNLHLNPESRMQCYTRLTEDRIASGTIVS